MLDNLKEKITSENINQKKDNKKNKRITLISLTCFYSAPVVLCQCLMVKVVMYCTHYSCMVVLELTDRQHVPGHIPEHI